MSISIIDTRALPPLVDWVSREAESVIIQPVIKSNNVLESRSSRAWLRTGDAGDAVDAVGAPVRGRPLTWPGPTSVWSKGHLVTLRY